MIQINYNKEKNKKGSNGMEPARLILNYGNFRLLEYLNVLVYKKNNHAGMAEWLTQLIDTQRPFGHVGSIPTPGVIFSCGGKR